MNAVRLKVILVKITYNVYSKTKSDFSQNNI